MCFCVGTGPWVQLPAESGELELQVFVSPAWFLLQGQPSNPLAEMCKYVSYWVL